jgi:glycosyltransferase involved in cell wall biosynthesis
VRQVRNVSFIIPAKCDQTELARTLNSLGKISNKNSISLETIVVENGMDPILMEVCKNYGANYYYMSIGNRSLARNIGALFAQSDWLVFLDSDVALDEEWLDRMILKIQTGHEQVYQGAIIPTVRENSFVDLYRLRYGAEQTPNYVLLDKKNELESPMVNAATCVYEKELFIKLGGFDLDLPRHEDIDLSKRAFLAGGKLLSVPEARSYVSFNGGTSLYLKRSFLHGFYKTLYWQKWGSFNLQELKGRSSRALFLYESFKKVIIEKNKRHYAFEFFNYCAISIGVLTSKVAFLGKSLRS